MSNWKRKKAKPKPAEPIAVKMIELVGGPLDGQRTAVKASRRSLTLPSDARWPHSVWLLMYVHAAPTDLNSRGEEVWWFAGWERG